MADLPTTKKLSKTQLLIREALKSAPPLKTTKPEIRKEFVVFEDQNSGKQKTNTLFDRYLTHRRNGSINSSANESPNKRKITSDYKWSQLKDNMTQELETKRLETQKIREMNDKLENEELIEVEDQLEEQLDKELDDNEDSDCESEDKEKDNNSDEEVSDGEEEDIEIEGKEEDNESERELNPFIDDEAEDEDEEEVQPFDKEIDNCSQSSDNLVSNLAENVIKDNESQDKRSQSIAEEEVNDNALNDSFLNTSINSLDESFDQKRCATQKIALSPFISQKIKPRIDLNQEFPDLISKLDTNVEEFNSQTLLDLCSGNFTQNVCQNEVISEETKDETQTNDNESQVEDEVSGEEEVDFSENKRNKKIFNVESDGESDVEEEDNKITEKVVENDISLNESDDEELVVTEAEVSDEEEGEVEEQDLQKIGKSFFDDEAELSGSEVSSDEDEGEDGYEVEDEDQEDLPSDSELKDQIGRFHNKTLLDEDKRQLLLMKEMMFEDGDLHDEGGVREKKFRWNIEEDNDFVNDYINEDSDDNYMDSDEDQNTKTPALKMFDQISDNKSISDGKQLKTLKSRFKLDFRGLESKKVVNSLAAFVVKDQRLNTILSKRNISAKSNQTFKRNKKFKSSKNNDTKPSVFDLINQY